jgi:hypothetical protein
MAMRVLAWTAGLALCATLYATPAYAQPYVAGALSADIARTGGLDGENLPGSGEAFSFSLRVGAAVTRSFGVELDFTRPSEIETVQSPDVRILAATTLLTLDGVTNRSAPIIGYEMHTARRATTITAGMWAKQDVSPRLSLVYLGGVAFTKLDQTTSTTFNYPLPALSIYPPAYEFTSVEYTQGPMAGIEARIALTEHAHLVPGLRLLAVGGGWIMRPAVGLGWAF